VPELSRFKAKPKPQWAAAPQRREGLRDRNQVARALEPDRPA